MCAQIREQNKQYLAVFEADLKAANLKPKTIEKHIFNVDFYINDYLLRYLPLEMIGGCQNEIDGYLGGFFIRKVMWSTPASIKSNATSIKKFYKSMMEHGYVDKENYTDLCDDIKECMPEWLAEWESYNDFDDLADLA